MGMGGNSNGGLNAAATTANPAAGSDIYTVLANMQRNSLSAQQQQRNSPQPRAHVVRSAYVVRRTSVVVIQIRSSTSCGQHSDFRFVTPPGTNEPQAVSRFRLPCAEPATGRQRVGRGHPTGHAARQWLPLPCRPAAHWLSAGHAARPAAAAAAAGPIGQQLVQLP